MKKMFGFLGSQMALVAVLVLMLGALDVQANHISERLLDEFEKDCIADGFENDDESDVIFELCSCATAEMNEYSLDEFMIIRDEIWSDEENWSELTEDAAWLIYILCF